jgi:signal transduction histidine kinase
MNHGLVMADPVRVAGHVAPLALVHVDGISADGHPLEQRGEVTIPPRRQRITVAFTGLSLSVPERVLFRYRLDGFDRDWSEPASLRQAVYTNLGPGTYKFHVIASNSDGLWNPSDSTMRFTIAPAFWQTAWSRLSGVLLLTAIGWMAYRVRLGQVARQLNVRFEERLAERTRIAQELHDTLLQGFVSASMQLHVAADRLPADSSAKSSLGRVVDLMGRVIEEGRNAVRSLRSSTESHDLEQAFSGMADELGSDGQLDYRVIVEGRVRPLNPMIRDDVYRIGREALVNAFRHSNAKRIEIELRYGSSELRMLVRDNGCGIDPQVLKSGRQGHWGLVGMRERAERIGARFKVWSSASAGTEIELLVPGHVLFAKEPPARQRGLTAGWRRYIALARGRGRMENHL